MHQAKVLWERGDYSELEKLFRRTADYCSNSETWKLNVAHVLYLQDNKFDVAASFYEPIVKTNYDNVRTTRRTGSSNPPWQTGPVSSGVSRNSGSPAYSLSKEREREYSLPS